MISLLYLIRHGETVANRMGVIAGQNDSPMTERGREQAAWNGDLLRQIASDLNILEFWASPLHRAVQTMKTVRRFARLETAGFSTDRRLMEMDHGDWTGMQYGEVRRLRTAKSKDDGTQEWDTQCPYGESWADLYARSGRFLAALKGPAVIVAHGGSLRMIRGHLLKVPKETILDYAPQNAGIWRFANGAETWFGE